MPHKISVLLVDDHNLVRRGFRRILEDEPDITVIGEASDGPDAIKLAGELNPKVIVMDCAMPGMNGLDLLDALRRIAPTLPVVVVSSHADLRTAALLRHADEFLAKPVRIDQLLATAAGLIDRAARRQEHATDQ